MRRSWAKLRPRAPARSGLVKGWRSGAADSTAPTVDDRRPSTVLGWIDQPFEQLQRRFSIPEAPDEMAYSDSEREALGAMSASRRCDFFGKAESDLVDWWSRELKLGPQSLTKWRKAIAAHNSKPTESLLGKSLVDVSEQLGQERRMLADVAQRLRIVLSPFVELREGGSSTFTNRGSNAGHISTALVAKRDVEPGMFLISVPDESVITGADVAPVDQLAKGLDTDPKLVEFFSAVDTLTASIFEASEDPENPWHAYATYLQACIMPPSNLPFMADPEKLLHGETARRLWYFFHHEMGQRPLCPALEATPTDAYQWGTSAVLSRRLGGASLVPIVDKLNHGAPQPNCYFTQATPDSFCGVDVADNLMAGVEAAGLYEPHLHVFAIKPIKAGEELTLSYLDDDPESDEGKDVWRSVYGFVPQAAAELKQRDLQQVAALVAERRMGLRHSLFPS